jgi:hypothetical protein
MNFFLIINIVHLDSGTNNHIISVLKPPQAPVNHVPVPTCPKIQPPLKKDTQFPFCSVAICTGHNAVACYLVINQRLYISGRETNEISIYYNDISN